MEDKVIVVEDWAPPPNPSPGAFVTSFLNDEFGSRSFSDLLAESGNDQLPFMGSDGNTIQSYGEENQFPSSLSFGAVAGAGARLFNDQKSSSRGGLSERRAVTTPKINTSRTRSADMSPSSPEIRSPYLTIPAGLSPTTLLDSPVFLSNSMAQQSPTTGKLLFGQGNNNNSMPEVPDASRVLDFEGFAPEAFAFKSHLGPGSYFSSTESKAQLITNSSVLATTDHQQPLSVTKMSVQSEYPVSFQNQQDFSFRSGFSDSSERNAAADDISLIEKVSSDSYTGNENSPPLDNQQDGEADTKGEFSSVTASAPADDGYNWRKYGQKQVKGSEFPRSYYKCTNLNCQVKKKVERSLEGHITEIVYKGVHNHPKPLPNRRSAVASSPPLNEMQYDGSEHTGSLGSFEAKPFLGSTQNGHDWKNDGLEASSAAAATEFCDPIASVQSQDGSRFETPDTIDVSSTVSNEDEEDRATHGSISQGGDGEGDEMESKRRKIDTYAIDMSVASRAIREPRVVVQTTSEVDILDDGYRWRKYGQKVVKGNPNPRSYYKCTHPGCTVRKHVERASNDLKSVITTYEGKHNHEVPAARNSGNHASSLSSITSGTSTTSLAHPFHRRAELTQDSLMRFGVRPPLSSFGFPGRETMGPSANFGFGMPHQGLRGPVVTGMNSVAQMKMPVLPPVRSFAGQRQTNEMGFATTKGEIKEEPMPDSRLPTLNGATIYHQMMGRLPLGPQL